LKQWEGEFNKIKDIYCANDINSMNISDEIEDLFYIFYKNDNIKDIYLKEILNHIRTFEFNNQINCYNIQIIGNSGVGKSTLINALLREEVAKTTIGSVGTLETKEYTSEKFPFIKFIDTRGTELDSANDIYKVKDNTLKYIEEKLSEKDPNKTIHCLFYCITGNRFEGIVKEVLLELRKKYKNGNLPIIIVYTQNNDVELFQQMKSYINTALMNANAQLSDKEEDINLVDVLAKKKENIVNGERLKPTKPFGLDKLLMLLKLKAKRAFIIATINMIKKYCVDKSILILEQILNESLKNMNFFISKENDANTILYNVLKNLFIKYVPKENLI
jgi:predicted GTPase